MTVLVLVLTIVIRLLPEVVSPFVYARRRPRPEGLTWRNLLFASDKRLTLAERKWRLEESLLCDLTALALLAGLALAIGLIGVSRQPAAPLVPALVAVGTARDAYRSWQRLGPLRA